jgi:hypothetical protein
MHKRVNLAHSCRACSATPRPKRGW